MTEEVEMGEVTNGELMRAINRLAEGQIKIETKVDVLRQDFARLATDVKVHETEDIGKFKAVNDRLDDHEHDHSETEKGSRFRTGAIIAAVTAASTLAAAAVAIAVSVH